MRASAFFSVAFAAAVLAQSASDGTKGYHALTKPAQDEQIPAGKKYTLVWTLSTLPDANGPVNLVLYAGPPAADLKELEVIAKDVDAKKKEYQWDVKESLGDDKKKYGVRIELASKKSTFQWSNSFMICKPGKCAPPPPPIPSSSSDASNSTSNSTESGGTFSIQTVSIGRPTATSGGSSQPTRRAVFYLS